MSITATIRDFFHVAAPYRTKFGSLRGMQLALRLRRAYTLAPGTPYTVRVPGVRHPVVLRAGTADIDVFQQVFLWEELQGEFDPVPSSIIDAGAHTGLASVYLATRFPDARIVALEVEPANFEMLRRNTAAYSGISIRHCGLWAKPARLRIADLGASSWGFRTVEATADAPETVPAVGVADLLDELGWPSVDFIKIDIEGAEIEVFSSAGNWIDRVGSFAVELHDRVRAGCTAVVVSALGDRFRCSRKGEYLYCARSPAS